MGTQDAEFNIIIHAKQSQKQYLKDLIRHRELFYFFAWRDILVRYKQAFFGISWALIRPLLTMAIFTLIFSKMAHLPSDNIPYSIFVLAAMLPWQLCANATQDTCNSLVNNAQLVSKTYFPRIIIPSAGIIVHLIDFAVGMVLLLVLSLIMGSINPLTVLALPLFIVLALALCTGVGLWLSALTVQYRDFRILVPFMLQFGMFASPVGYATFVVPEKWLWLYFFNPLVGIIDGFRWSIFGVAHSYFIASLAYSMAISTLLLVSGFYYFRKMERTFADKI